MINISPHFSHKINKRLHQDKSHLRKYVQFPSPQQGNLINEYSISINEYADKALMIDVEILVIKVYNDFPISAMLNSLMKYIMFLT